MKKKYAVVWVATGQVVYTGASPGTTARLLKPGTCHGEGADVKQAVGRARRLAERIRLAKRLPAPEYVNKHTRGRGPRSKDPTRSSINEAARQIREDGHDSERYGWRPPWDAERLLG
jgi:hypothetical protein